MDNNMQIINISGIDCYEKDGVAYLKLEAVARGLGFTEVAASGNECVTWTRVRKYLSDLGFIDTRVDGKELPDFIPENVFYRLAMKAKNEVAEAFQAKVADEIIPSIRKHGGYIANQEQMTDQELLAKAFLVSQNIIAERDKRIAQLQLENKAMLPKAEYFDALCDRNTLLSVRDTVKELHIPERKFTAWLVENGYCFRNRHGALRPYANTNNGYFEMKEFVHTKPDGSQYSGTQMLVTPRGREMFRLLCTHLVKDEKK